jgi:hypothetical protein
MVGDIGRDLGGRIFLGGRTAVPTGTIVRASGSEKKAGRGQDHGHVTEFGHYRLSRCEVFILSYTLGEVPFDYCNSRIAENRSRMNLHFFCDNVNFILLLNSNP